MFFAKKTVVVQIEGKVAWEVTRDPDTGVWIGRCDALRANAAGENWEQFIEAMLESMQLLFEELFATGELEAFLRHQGWSLTTPVPPRSRVRFSLPFTLAQASTRRELVTA